MALIVGNAITVNVMMAVLGKHNSALLALQAGDAGTWLAMWRQIPAVTRMSSCFTTSGTSSGTTTSHSNNSINTNSNSIKRKSMRKTKSSKSGATKKESRGNSNATKTSLPSSGEDHKAQLLLRLCNPFCPRTQMHNTPTTLLTRRVP